MIKGRILELHGARSKGGKCEQGKKRGVRMSMGRILELKWGKKKRRERVIKGRILEQHGARRKWEEG